MRKIKDFAGKNVAIVGFGLEGKDACNYLQAKGSKISVYDVKEKSELDLSDVNTKGVNFFCGTKYNLKKLVNYDYVFRSPGVYRYLPELVACDNKGIEVTSSIKLFLDLCPAKTIGVTGTKGKGTTSTLIYEILKSSGLKVYLTGNIGKPCLELLDKVRPSDWVVLELSSFQLIDCDRSPNVAVVLNITVDHLDWHKDRREYINAKKNIIVHQKSGDISVINSDYPEVKRFAKLGSGKKYFFSKSQKVNGAYVKNGTIFSGENIIGGVKELKLRGKHNWENITAAVCASRIAKATIFAIKNTVFSFKGLEHRLELVRNYKGIGFYNDSFSTNPQTTIAAVHSFDEPVTLILGGFDKNLDYSQMAREIKKANCAACVLIGDIAEKIKKCLIQAGFKGKILETKYSSMSVIVKESYAATKPGGVVVLSPASSSFDMFKNYKERGWQFKKAVLNLR